MSIDETTAAREAALAAARDEGPAGAAATVADLAARDLAAAVLLAGHHAARIGLRAAGEDEALRAADERGWLLAPVPAAGRELHGAAQADAFLWGDSRGPALVAADDPAVALGIARPAIGLGGAPAASVRAPQPGSPGAIADAAHAVLTASAIAGAVSASIASASAAFLARPLPRPVPGVTAPAGDPLAQVVLGAALGPAAAAHALVADVVGELEALLEDSTPSRTDGPILARSLAALDVAVGVALTQGREVYEVVGTSGSGNRHGFDRLWRDVRTLSLSWPRGERRAAVGAAFLAA